MTWPQYQRGSCTVDGEEVYLGPLEAQILSILLIRRGHCVTKEEMFDQLWPDVDTAPMPKTVDVHICKLRRKVPGVVETVWGRGFIIYRPGDPPMARRKPSDYLLEKAA